MPTRPAAEQAVDKTNGENFAGKLPRSAHLDREELVATSLQLGAIIAELERLGVVVRSERLAICAALLGLSQLESTTALTLGQAGMLVRQLRGISDRAELPGGNTAAADEILTGRGPVSIVQMIRQFILAP